LFIQLDDNPAHGPHLIEPRGNVHTDAKVFIHPLLQTLQVIQVFEVLQTLEQALLLLPREQEDALRR
jgi:hypothetical protein